MNSLIVDVVDWRCDNIHGSGTMTYIIHSTTWNLWINVNIILIYSCNNNFVCGDISHINMSLEDLLIL